MSKYVLVDKGMLEQAIKILNEASKEILDDMEHWAEFNRSLPNDATCNQIKSEIRSENYIRSCTHSNYSEALRFLENCIVNS